MVDNGTMHATRTEARLGEIRDKIEALYGDRGDDGNLPVRYDSLVALEAALHELVRQHPMAAKP